MQKRNIQILFRLSEEEYKKLAEKVRKSGLKREVYIRSVLDGYKLKEQPSVDFFKVLKALDSIGNNMNQIAARANSTGKIYAEEYQKNADELNDVINELFRRAFS